ALKTDASGALWIGTDNGAARSWNGKFDAIPETAGKVITAIITPQADRAIMVSESGQIFDCVVKRSNSTARPGEGTPGLKLVVNTIPSQPLQSADKDHPGPLKLTSLAMVGEKLYVGTQSRGILMIENGEAKDVVSKPRSYFINAMVTDGRGRLWVGSQGRGDGSALVDSSDPIKPDKAGAPTGTVTAIAAGAGEDIWVGTDGHGAFRFSGGKQIAHFTFEGTGGALRSDHIFGVFVDAEEVVWFATDKGVCRYDPHAMRAENISDDPSANYIRVLWRTSKGNLLAGPNPRFVTYEPDSKNWRAVSDLNARIVYAIGEDQNGRVLIATPVGLFASQSGEANFQKISAPNEKLPQGDNLRAITNVNGTTYIGTYGF